MNTYHSQVKKQMLKTLFQAKVAIAAINMDLKHEIATREEYTKAVSDLGLLIIAARSMGITDAEIEAC